jgi:hypothetical protein
VLIYVEDPEAQARYLLLRGDVERCAREVRAGLAAYGEEELLAMLERKTGRAQGLRCAAVGLAASHRAELSAAVRAALDHRDPELRLAALWAAGFAGLAELRAAVHRLAARDPQPALREIAGALEEQLG